jgi:hypothetical protein
MKNLLQLLLFAIILHSCQKTTDVNGTFTNNATGLPIKGIRIALFATNTDGKGVTNTISEDADSTDENGKYNLHVEAGSADILLRADIPNGFVEPKARYIKNGKTRTEDYALKPYDAFLRLTLQHDSINASKIYYYFIGAFYEDQSDPSNPGALKGIEIPLGESKTFVHLVPGGQTIGIVWDTKKFNIPLNPFPHISLVDCPRNDTTDFVLKY